MAQYQAVIDKYGSTRIDFDVEGSASADAASIARRSQAIASLETRARSAGKWLDVPLTLPVLPSGLTADGMNGPVFQRRRCCHLGGQRHGHGLRRPRRPQPRRQDGPVRHRTATSLFGQLRSFNRR